MRTGYEQNAGLLSISSPFNDGDLLLDALEGSEGLSELFCFQLHMRSPSTSLDPKKIIGETVTVNMQVPGGELREITGLVSRFIQSGFDRDFAVYQAELVPQCWILKLSRDRKIYQNKSVSDVIISVLSDFEITIKNQLATTYEPVDYIVQYDETAFDFITRLMQLSGIFYFFTFSGGDHTMVLADDSSAFETCSGAATVRFFPETGQSNPLDTVVAFSLENAIQLKRVTSNDYDFTTPSTSLEGTDEATTGFGEVYEFGAGQADSAGAAAIAKLRNNAAAVGAKVLRGDSFAYPFMPGTKFTMTEHFVEELNAEFVLKRVQHIARDDHYSNSFESFPSTVVYSPSINALKPKVSGCESALVVGPSGEEIWTDEYGRIKLQFPWDRDGLKDENSSPWVRVSQSMAGSGFGSIFIPRIGQEVIVTYLQGDPERPIVTGCVYNGENAAPMQLPANQTQTIIRTWSSKEGTAGNELRFEDKKDAEDLYLHAQKDMTVEVENDLKTTLMKGTETHIIQEGDRSLDIQKGSEIHKVQATRQVEVVGDENHTNSADFTHDVTGDYALIINGALTITVTGSITVKSDADIDQTAGTGLSLTAGTAFKNTAGTAFTSKAGTELMAEAGTNLTNKAGMKLLSDAGMQIDQTAAIINSKASATQTVEAGALLTLKGALAKVN
jgi:type VI secretion system secreted protein VgrG|tara:strand:+ start:455 stop:2470 length:2016 start_codon:yes stop_codon:yes gene_type:complete